MRLYRSIVAVLSALVFASVALAADTLPIYLDQAGKPQQSRGVVLLSPSGMVPNKPTYNSVALAYAAYATPTDLFCLWGSATKTVKVVQVILYVQSTAAALQTIYLIRRSTADTGGTPTNPTIVKLDTTSPTATAVFTTYGAAPTLGTSLGTFALNLFASATLTTSPVAQAITTFVVQGNRLTDNSQLILRGANEGICYNYNGAALTSGFAANVVVAWAEE